GEEGREGEDHGGRAGHGGGTTGARRVAQESWRRRGSRRRRDPSAEELPRAPARSARRSRPAGTKAARLRRPGGSPPAALPEVVGLGALAVEDDGAALHVGDDRIAARDGSPDLPGAAECEVELAEDAELWRGLELRHEKLVVIAAGETVERFEQVDVDRL